MLLRRAHIALRDLSRADMDLLVAGQRAERTRLLRALSSRLRLEHLSHNAGVVALFASRRAALTMIADPAQRAAAMARLAAEETVELAALALAHAAEVRAARRSILLTLSPLHRQQRRALRLRSRRRRLSFALLTHRGTLLARAVDAQSLPGDCKTGDRRFLSRRRYHRRRAPQLRA